MNAVGVIWQISLYAAVFGFWPAMFLIFTVWGHYKDGTEPSTRIKEWFPAIVIPWVASVGVFLAIFLYLIFFALRR